MLEWHVTEESSAPLPDDDPQEPPSPTSRRLLMVLVALLILFGATAVGLVAWRFRDGETALKADLVAQIRDEETARRFGQTVRLPALIAETVPQWWRERFASHFRTPVGDVQAVEVGLERVEIEGGRATAWVRVGQLVQRRAYVQTGGGWRRVPVGNQWSGESQSMSVPYDSGSLTLRYSATDADFATQLAADLPTLLREVEAWQGEPLRIQTLSIVPQELEPGVAAIEFQPEGWLTLNSPQVVAPPATWDLSGASAVRYDLALYLLRYAFAEQGIAPTPLPNISRFNDALATTIALRWAITDAEQTALRTQWHNVTEGEAWQSPFFALSKDTIPVDPFVQDSPAAEIFLVADVFAAEVAAQPRPALQEALRDAPDWDTFFTALTPYTTLEIEALAAQRPALTPPTLPFTAAPIAEGDEGMGWRGVAVRSPDHPQTMVVEGLDKLPLHLPDGSEWDARCAPLFQEVQIDGTWREAGLRLVARDLSVGAVAPPLSFTLSPAPDDTLLYLAQGRDNGLVYNNNALSGILALRPDGSRSTVLTDTVGLTIRMVYQPFGMGDSNSGIMLRMESRQSGCNAEWWVRYVPTVGITGAWLAQSTSRSSDTFMHLWDEQSGRGVLIDTALDLPTEGAEGSSGTPFWWLDEGEPQQLGAPDGMLPRGTVRGLRPGATHVAMMDIATETINSREVWLVNLSDGTVSQRLLPQAQRFQVENMSVYINSMTFDVTGDALYVAYTDSARANGDHDNSFVIRYGVSETDRSIETWWTYGDGTVFLLLADRLLPQLYTIAAMPSSVLELVRFDAERKTVLAQNDESYEISYVQSCGRGDLLYVTIDRQRDVRSDNNARSLHLLPPNATDAAQTATFALDINEFPVMCP